MKKTLLAIIFCVFSICSTNAQFVNIYKEGVLLNSYESSTVDSVTFSISKPYITTPSFSFLKSTNDGKVLEDLSLEITGDTLTFDTPLILDPSGLIASFETDGDTVTVNDVPQVSGETLNDFTSPVTYKIISNGEVKEVVVKITCTRLPVLYINTPNSSKIASKEVWMENASIRLVDIDGAEISQGTSIKGRGNSTWSYPKKSYSLKLDKKAELLGMPSNKRWCLLANWMDRTMMRNAVSFEIARQTDLAWTPKGQFVEVILNGNHIGNYYLCEQIKVGENRVNIAELNEEATEGENITGGYIFELDINYDEIYKFMSAQKNLPWMFKDPDKVNEQQFAYVQQYVNDMEEALYNDSIFTDRGFVNYMDLGSFADYWIIYELAQCFEPNHPKSTYMYKDKNGKMCAGPVWDFDYGTYRTPSGFYLKNALYYDRLFQDADFKSMVKERWNTYKSKFQDIVAFIEQLEIKLADSDKLNSPKWPITLEVNGDEKLSYTDAVAKLKDSYQSKLDWLDSQISAW